MTEAALFYELAHANLGDDFLDDVRFAIDSVRESETWHQPRVRLSASSRSEISLQHHLLRGPGTDRRGGGCASKSPPGLLEDAHMTANHSLQRTIEHRGRTARACMFARAGAEGGSCLAAERQSLEVAQRGRGAI